MFLSLISIMSDDKLYYKFLDKLITDNYNYIQDVEYDMESISLSPDISDANTTISQKTGKSISIKRSTLPKIHLYIDRNHNLAIFYKEYGSLFDKLLINMEQDLDVDVWVNGRRVNIDDVDLNYIGSDRYSSDIWDIVTTIKQIWWVSVVISDMLGMESDTLSDIDDLHILSRDMKMIWLDYNTMYIR